MKETHVEITIDRENCLIIRNQAVPLTQEEEAGPCQYCQMQGYLQGTYQKVEELAERVEWQREWKLRQPKPPAKDHMATPYFKEKSTLFE